MFSGLAAGPSLTLPPNSPPSSKFTQIITLCSQTQICWALLPHHAYWPGCQMLVIVSTHNKLHIMASTVAEAGSYRQNFWMLLPEFLPNDVLMNDHRNHLLPEYGAAIRRLLSCDLLHFFEDHRSLQMQIANHCAKVDDLTGTRGAIIHAPVLDPATLCLHNLWCR